MAKNNNHKAVSYNKWGYIFLIPFVVVYLIFQLVPLISTIYNSFFENYREGLTQVGPNFVGLKNYITLFTPDKNGTIDILKYAGNTIVLWIGGARKFMRQIRPRTVKRMLKKSIGASIQPSCVRIWLIGPTFENSI